MNVVDQTPHIEFMDLTDSSSAAYLQHDADGRRRRRPSNTLQDKEATSNMRIRRRAQNRASQRAFRERKEKHVQQLEAQMAELEAKHKALARNYTDLVPIHKQLKEEAEKMKEEIRMLKRAGSSTPSSSSVDDVTAIKTQSDWGVSLFDDDVDAGDF